MISKDVTEDKFWKVKLQGVDREGRKTMHTMHIPFCMVEELCWEKGDSLKLEVRLDGDTKIITISKIDS